MKVYMRDSLGRKGVNEKYNKKRQRKKRDLVCKSSIILQNVVVFTPNSRGDSTGHLSRCEEVNNNKEY